LRSHGPPDLRTPLPGHVMDGTMFLTWFLLGGS
jgi:hypothetical protein